MIDWNQLWLLCALTIIVLHNNYSLGNYFSKKVVTFANRCWPNDVILAYSTKNIHQLERIEPLTNIKYKIAPRSPQFFTKRHQSRSTYIEPKHIEYDDHIQLTLEAYNTTFQLNLEPNFDLFHPQVAAGTLPRIQVYKGHVLSSTTTTESDIMNTLGWARIIIRNDLMS